MNIAGKDLIEIICNRLRDKNILLHDGCILGQLRSMSAKELLQATTLSDVSEWHNERIKNSIPPEERIL